MEYRSFRFTVSGVQAKGHPKGSGSGLVSVGQAEPSPFKGL